MAVFAMGPGPDPGGIKSGVAVAHLLFAQRAVDTAGNRVTNPNDDAEQDDGKNELKSIDHESYLP
jgi:hypothetical protein